MNSTCYYMQKLRRSLSQKGILGQHSGELRKGVCGGVAEERMVNGYKNEVGQEDNF